MPTKPSRLNAVGQTYHDFKVTKAIEIPELQCFLRELVHLPTGAQVMDIYNDDPENFFCLSFRTLPDSSNGVAHILEHTVLCGSEKFPVKDPFFAMSRRSLNTYMNALTGSDFTCYPAASQVHKDFYNLLEVYLDAVFHPKLDELSFLQEGHRLEFAIPQDSESPLEYKGVVFNEMKGALATPSARITEAMNAALFPDITYGYNSGGDPKNIPDLSYNELIAFHQTYYLPSRCLFFFYGNMPLEGHLEFISKHILKNAKEVPPIPAPPLQQRMTQPKRLILEYPLSADEDPNDKTLISFGWLTCHILEQQELLALNILEIILMDTDASPLKLALLKSGLCKQAGAYMEDEISEVPMVITLRGCNPENADPLEEVILKTLKEVMEKGIALELIENAMHQLEFFRSEITGNHAPFGLSLFMRSALLKQHNGHPEDGLMIHSLFDQLRRTNLENPHYFSELIKKYFIDNTHFVRIVMVPNKLLGALESQEEKLKLQTIQNELNTTQKAHIIQKSSDLVRFQKRQEEEDVDILPKITLDDIPKTVRQYPLTIEKQGKLQLFHHNCFTNGIVYADAFFDLPAISQEDLPLVRLLTVFISQVGCGGRKYDELLDYIQAHTGGIGAYLTFNIQATNHDKFFPSLGLRGKALHRKVNKLFPLMHDMIRSIDFSNHGRLKEVLLKHYTSLHSSLQQSALKYAMNLSSSGLDIPSKIANAWYGLDYFWAIKELVENIDSNIGHLAEKLTHLHSQLFGLENPDLVLSCNAAIYDELKRHDFYGLQNMDTKSFKPWSGEYLLSKVPNQGRIIATPIAFISKILKTISYTHPDAPALSIAAAMFENITLHIRIREQGGAYGGGCVNNAMAGSFCFYSYRDPNISKTFEAFDEAIRTVVSGDFTETDLEEAKLEIIQGQDTPVAPGSRADVAYAWLREGRTTEMRQSFRNRLLKMTSQDIIKAVKKHIVEKYESGISVVFADKALLERENTVLIDQGKPPLVIETI